MPKTARIASLHRLSAALLLTMAAGARADLQQLIDENVFNALEQEAAIAALATYDRLIADAGCRDDQATGEPGGEGESACVGQTFQVFENVREIVHTANEITNDGPTAFSLGSDLEGLGFALRWTAAEEYAAQGNLSGEFVGGQLSGLATRLTALRAGARGFNVIGIANVWPSSRNGLATAVGGQGDSDGSNYGRWGGFLTFDFGNGRRDPTDLEDAFDFENQQISFGLDYRLDNRWVLGAIVGISDQEVDFDSSVSIVEGGIVADGWSVQPFAMVQGQNWYGSFAFGVQQMQFETERAIRYPSFNPDSESTDTVAVSASDADMWSLFSEVGYTWRWRQLSIEPYANLKYSDIAVDGFVEDDLRDDAFDLEVEGQDISTQELTLGVKFQWTLTPSFGVFIPYFGAELVNQTDDAPRTIEARYAQDPTDGDAFAVPTEALDSQYSVLNLGLSSVVRGARQRSAGGRVGGDLQAFFNYRTLQGLEDFTVDFYSLGLRYTF